MPQSTSGFVTVMNADTSIISSTESFTITATGVPTNQQGLKLVGTGNVGGSYQGISAAISANGNTALVGGYSDNSNLGAAWVFTRSGTTWTQQGSKLVGTGNVGASNQGNAIGLSADGNTALIGGSGDASFLGATWVFTRSGTTWTQQGSKLVGSGYSGSADQGASISVSGDGNTALIGAYRDATNIGAAWIFTP